MNQIQEFATRIGREFGAHKVLLFGSHARGPVTDDSDVDLLVIRPFTGKSVQQSVEIRLRLRPTFPVDLLVRTPEHVRRRLELGDDFIRRIIEEGRVLYETDHV